MKCNATLRYELLHECGIDDNGEPLDYEQLWSEPIPCFVKTVSDTRLGTYEDGEFRSAKFVVWVETREITYSRLGRRFGGRDHSTVLYACNQVVRRMSVDKAFRHEVEEMEAALNKG